MLGKAEHVINGKKVDPKKAKARHGKIFVGGLKPEMTDDDIKNHFAAMGTVRGGTGGTAPDSGCRGGGVGMASRVGSRAQ